MIRRGALRAILYGFLACSVTVMGSTAIQAKTGQRKSTLKPFDITLATIGKTQVRIRYRYAGEPISQPERFEVLFKCAGKRDWHPYRDFSICGLRDHRYDARTGKLSIGYLSGRVVPETGRSFCDIPEDDEIEIADWCGSMTSAQVR